MENTLKIFTVISEKENVTIGALEKMLGASKGVLSRAINKGTDVQSKWLLLLIEKFPEYDYNKMLRGEFSTNLTLLNEPKSTYTKFDMEDQLRLQLRDKEKIIEMLEEKIKTFEDKSRGSMDKNSLAG